MDKALVRTWTTVTLDAWNAGEYKNYPESSIEGKYATIRLSCCEPLKFVNKPCNAHFVNIAYFVTKDGEKLCRISCNACSIYKTRKLGQGFVSG